MIFTGRHSGTSSLVKKLLVGSALSAIAASSAQAQGTNAASTETVVVTGTSIRGAAPVGAALQTVGQAQIQDTMQPTAQSLLADIPELGNFATAGVGNQNNDRAGGFTPTIHNVGAGSSIATLTLINGHRFPTTGLTESNTDPTIVAPSALQRVEILPDGASSIYGADAVVGVVNFITRQNYKGMELNAQAGLADSYHTFNGSAVFGTTWTGGSLMLAYDYSSKSHLMNRDRSFVTARQDIRLGAADPALFTAPGGTTPTIPANQVLVTPAAGPGTTGPYGATVPLFSLGSNFQNFNCPVASVQGSGNIFYYQPGGGYGGTGVANVSASGGIQPGNGACDTVNAGSLLASETRNNVFIETKQEISDNLALDMTFSFATRVNLSPQSRGTLQATAFGGPTTPTGILATQINPYFQSNASIGTVSETVRYSFDDLLGPGAFDKLYMNNGFLTADLTWDLGGEREITVGGVAGLNFNQQHDGGQVSAGNALLALNGSTASNGVIGNSIFDPNGLGSVYPGSRVLTTLNALDVWNPAASNKTSAAVRKSLIDGGFDQQANQTIQDLKVKFDGPIFDMPAGPVKVAVGSEYLHQTMEEGGTNNTSAGGSLVTSQAFYYRTGRTVYSAYAEVQVPLVSEEMGVPLMQSFALDFAGRYDKYSDFGDTENPKVSFDWFILDGLKARGSAGTSFVSPGLHDALGTNNQSVIGAAGNNPAPFNVIAFGVPNTFNGGAGTAGTWVATPQGCAAGHGQVLNAAGTVLTQTASGPTAAGAFACRVNFGATDATTTSAGLSIAGGHLGLLPAHGRSYSLGMDADFGRLVPFLKGLVVSATYWQTTYVGLITGGANVHPSLTYFAPCPDPVANCGAAPQSAFVQNFLQNRVLGLTVQPITWETRDNRLNNSFDVWMNGFDVHIDYALRTDDMGTFKFGWSGTETLRYSQSPHVIGGVTAEANLVDAKDGRNSPRYGGASNELSFRATVGWQFENYGLQLGMKFIQPQLGTDSNFPYSLSGPGRGQVIPSTGLFQSSGFTHLQALQVFDLLASYTVPSGFFGMPASVTDGMQATLKIDDLLDNGPSFDPSATSSIGSGNPIGRMFTIGVRKKF